MLVRSSSAIARISIVAFSLLTVAGCSTLETAADDAHDFIGRHPVATAIATGIVVGGAVAALDRHHHDERTLGWREHGTPCEPDGHTECRP